ncbi:glycogen synthase GlgA [Amorphus coralli]|uniref:glycogen synthase GlgA n=1 Tax=Amorphus coralli TaxID=340680 RepID=UPI0003697A7B|nr:glycogen synthase GlgA [Amorphus coralli]
MPAKAEAGKAAKKARPVKAKRAAAPSVAPLPVPSGPPLQLLSVASEVFPLVKTGGLADVVGALPAALAEEGVQALTFVPGYPAVMEALEDGETVADLDPILGGEARVLRGRAAGLDLAVLDAPSLFARPGGPYSMPGGGEWSDNGVRFGTLCRAAALVARGAIDGYRPDVVHCHDWQAGLTPAYLHFSPDPAPPSVATIHNIAFQGQMPPDILGELGLPPEAYSIEGVEYYGSVGYLKSAVRLADRVTTVSPTYAREIRSSEFGMGLEGLIAARGADVSGILNGIDLSVWNPETDPSLAARFSRTTLGRRSANKPALLSRLGLDPDSNRPLFGVVSRLTWQKGIDLLVEALGTLLGQDADLVVLGSGEPALESALSAAASRHPDRIGVQLGYDEALAHLIQAGADALLIPSRFEPCGLTQLCALRYGAIPVAARVGGLSDTIVDTNEMARRAGVGTGVLFSPVGREPFEQALVRTCELYRSPATWRRMQTNALRTDVGWAGPARTYADLFRQLATPAVTQA